MENEKRLSIKDFNEKVAIFEGDKQNSAKKDFYEKIAMFEGTNRSSKKLKEKKDKNKGQFDDSKNKLYNKHIDQFILEKLKIYYKPSNRKSFSQKNSSTDSGENVKNKIEKINNNINSQEEEIKYINKYIKGIRNKENLYNLNEKNFPKKLNIKEIFTKMNIEQIASNVNEEKRNELLKLSLSEKEKEKNSGRITNSQKNEKKIIYNDKEMKNEINNQEKSTDKIIKKNTEEMKKEEKIIKNEKSNVKNFISSLNDLYNKKFITINNNDKVIQKQEKSKKQILNIETPPNPSSITRKSQELYLNTNENIFLEEKIISPSEEKKYDTDKFCECFFLASFPTDDGKIAPNSEILPADCGHEICSQLPAMEPDIIYKYPEDIKNFEINNLAASICFPNGIKLCYEENEENIKVIKNYRSTLTNQNGNMFFVYTYHFYLKMSNEDFRTSYNMHPIRYQLTTYQDELCSIFTEEQEENIVKKLEIYSDCNFKENVYIPFCLGLISKYPFYPQIEKSLKSIFETIKNSPNEANKINNLIMYLLKSIPVPHKNSKVSFSLPFINKICEIHYPYFQDILLFGNNPMIILEHFSINNIISIFKLLIFEQKIIVIGEDMDKISEIILNLISLIYPFEWIHTYIPVMSMKMLKFLESFLPFLNGMNISLYNEAKSFLAKSEDVFIINVDDDTIDVSNNLRKKDKSFKGSTYINKNFSALPKSIENVFLKELKLIKIELEKYKNYNIFDKQVINSRIKNLFFQVLVEILYGYDKYAYIIDDYPAFNAFSMINEKPKSDKRFYEELTNTQIFQMFIQKSLLNDDLNFYFDKKIKEYDDFQKQGLNLGEIINFQSKNLYNEYLASQKINKNYIIKPYLIANYNKYEEEMKMKNKSITFKDVNEFIYSQNFINDKGKNTNNDSIKNNLIIDNLFKFDSKEFPNSYKIFLIPNNTNKNKNENILDINNNQNGSRISKRKSTKIKIISGEKQNEKGIRYAHVINERDDELNEEQKDEIIDNIKDIMKRVYKSNLLNVKEDQEILMDSVKTNFGRDYFVNIIGSVNKKNSSIKIVENESFDFLKYIIFSVLLNILKLEENEHNLFSALKLTKACLYIKTSKNKKEVSLSDEIFSQLEDYALYKNKIFWQMWIEDDMTEDEIDIYNKLKSKEESIKSDEKYKIYLKNSYEIVDKLFGIMIKLKLSNFFIYSTYSELSREYIFDDDQFGKLMREMINGLEYYQKLSKNNLK